MSVQQATSEFAHTRDQVFDLRLTKDFIFIFRFSDQAEPVLIRIRGVRLLWSDVEQLRAESYSEKNKEHENMLLEVN